ncbi:hypothetical protein X802_09805 [Thermococcus guaymasensis DSM 11113]|uniref:Rubrerythrin diiron-binding domain-containing protein n=1 Tax=Thermococcus guaymasensis DSM 11113 TaxID=1432656 RepID=A0A0X1KNH6_9EURY|nr:hypothetical protein X802_09805 [Thermococcus guaymasensis DSM 11113]
MATLTVGEFSCIQCLFGDEDFDSEVDAVRIGMEQEKLTREFYEKVAKEAKHESVRRIFEELAKIEKA